MPSTPAPLDLYIYLLFLCFGTGALLPMLLSLFTRRKDLLTFLSLMGALAGGLVTITCAVSAWQDPLTSHALFQFTSAPIPILAQTATHMPEIAFVFYADRLAAFFLLLAGVFTVAVTLHLTSWLEDLSERHRIAGVFNLFALGIVMTLLSNTVYSFLLFQETMTLAFAYLALFRHNLYLEKEDVPDQALEASKTAFKAYLIFEHVGIMLIAIALLLLSAQGTDRFPVSFSFFHFRDMAMNNQLKPPVPSLVFLFALAGFGIKAGVFPAHVWVPMVHPYSPTSIHAMMSGIALKVAGLYGMYRVFFFFLAPLQWWWGWLVLLLAGATALFGVFYALPAKDLKTALASHSVENVGIILAGIGLALVFYAESGVKYAAPPLDQFNEAQHSYLISLAGLALIASLYHLMNHSVFKGLLFFCTGAIENRLGVVALDKLGGLMKRYPLTSTAFLIGSVSIAGFPPFNGFVSEWLLLQALFAGMGVYFARIRVLLLVGVVLVLLCLALSFSLTALAFVKIAGETLLGAPRDPQVAKNARPGEVRWPMRVVLITFSALCLLLGLVPAVTTQMLARPALDMVAGLDQNPPIVVETSLALQIRLINPQVFHQQSQAEPMKPVEPMVNYETQLANIVIMALSLILAYAIGFSLLVMRRRAVQVGPPWTCGVPFFDRLMQYTGTAFASLMWMPFDINPTPAPAALASSDPGSPQPAAGKPESLPYRLFVTSRRYVPEVTRQAYNNLVTWALALCEKIGRAAQPGDIRVYLLYIFVLFISILIYLLFRQGAAL